MGIFAQLTVNGLIAGSIYALVAAGFSMIYSTNRFMHFAHGIGVVVSAYILYTLFGIWGMSFAFAVILTLILSSAFGIGMYRVIYLPLQEKKASNIILLIASIGILILFENLILAIYGADVKTIGFIEVSRGMNVLGAIVTPLQMVIILSSIVIFGIMFWFMGYTKTGRDMRAVSDNKELSSIVGINYKRIADYSFIIGSLLAAVAGILIGLEQNLEPTMGTNLVIKGFTGAVIGGMASVPASVLGSYILGFAENYGIWYLPSGYKDAIAFILLFIFLLFRPTGLFGTKRRVS
jgi:branched-chain amino acid transport system permease protein